MSDRNEDNLFFGGMPIGPDLKKLERRWPDLKPGDKIPYAEIEKLLNISRTAGRFKSVTNRFRRELMERGLPTACAERTHFLVLNADQAFNMEHARFSKIQRSAHRGKKVMYHLRVTDEKEIRKRDHIYMLLDQTERAAKERKSIMNAPNVESLPRISPPKEAG